MGTHRRVVLYGKSVVLGAVGASLRRFPDLEIIPLATPSTAQELRALSPDVILFDLEAAHPDAALSLLQARPGLLLIGIDPATDQMQLWSGEHRHALATDDLVRAIHALPGEGRAQASWAPNLESWWQSITAWAAGRQKPSRKMRLALGVVAVAVCSLVLVAESLLRPVPSAPLVATAAGELGALHPALAFAAGVLLGGVLIGWWLHWGKPAGGRGSSTDSPQER